MNLRGLILLRCAQLGLSYREVAKRATKAGHPVSGGTIARWAKVPELKAAPKSGIQGLPAALEVRPHVVGQAVLESLGISWDEAVPTDDGGVRFEVSGNGWTEDQLATFRRAMERAVHRTEQRFLQQAERTVHSRPKRKPIG